MEPRYFFADADGRILGPTVLKQLQVFIETGHLTRATDVCPENETEWVPLSTVIDAHEEKLRRASEEKSLPRPALRQNPAAPVQAAPIQPLPAPVPALPAGPTVAGLLKDIQSRPILARFSAGEPFEASIENVGLDFVTLSVNTLSGIQVWFIPLSRLYRIVEDVDHDEMTLEFA